MIRLEPRPYQRRRDRLFQNLHVFGPCRVPPCYTCFLMLTRTDATAHFRNQQ